MAALDETEGLDYHFPNEAAHSRRGKEGARQAVWREKWMEKKKGKTSLPLPNTHGFPEIVYVYQ